MEVFSLNTIGHVHHFSDDPDLNSVLVFNTLQTEDKFAAMHLFQSDRVPVCDSYQVVGFLLFFNIFCSIGITSVLTNDDGVKIEVTIDYI